MQFLCAFVILLGAFLGFLVQPLVGNTLIPAFGGSASVWTTCLATFQILLVGGYFYAHAVGAKCGVRSAKKVLWAHVGLLLVGAAWALLVSRALCFVPCLARFPVPALGALAAVLALVAVPYVLLSANSTLVQVLSGGRYGLYAVSNIGSFLGLLAYPFLFETKLTIPRQWQMLGVLIGGYAFLFCVLCLMGARRGAQDAKRESLRPHTAQAVRNKAHYFFLAFASCYLLNAVSTHLCTDVAPLPMLWVVLLSLYLLSYVVAFTDRGSALAAWLSPLFVPLAVAGMWQAGRHLGGESYAAELWVGLALLFLGGWIVHSRLYRTRPPAEGLTAFYLMIAVGGAAGGAACSFLMPLVSDSIVEYPIAVAVVLWYVICDVGDFVGRRFGLSMSVVAVRCVWGGLAVFAVAWICRARAVDGVVLCRYRNFHGIGQVVRQYVDTDRNDGYWVNLLKSGETVHGYQKVDGEWKGQMATSYYVEEAGGLAVLSHPKFAAKEPMNVAVCGMGIGTMATYARAGDRYRFYEINPTVAEIAANPKLFSFLSGSMGKVEVVVDDARRALERERAEGAPRHDVLIVDVFTGDSIPPHMATKEAVSLYLERLEEDGILAFHLSNWQMNLLPMVRAFRDEFGLEATAVYTRPTHYGMGAVWAFLSRKPLSVRLDQTFNKRLELDSFAEQPIPTDEFHPLLPYLLLFADEHTRSLGIGGR